MALSGNQFNSSQVGSQLGATRRPQTAGGAAGQSRYGGLSSETMGKTKHMQKSGKFKSSTRNADGCCPNEMTFSPGKSTFTKSNAFSPHGKERAGSADGSEKKSTRIVGGADKHVSFYGG